MTESSRKRILCVGLVCLDVVHVVKDFPQEDTDQRSLGQYASRGGNASNNCSVLAELGEPCEYFGTLAADTHELAALEEDFQRFGIHYSHCPRHKGCICPNSCVIMNAKNASRTIIHTNVNLPELTAEEFIEAISLEEYSWVHFEGRNVFEVIKMISHVRATCPTLPVSVEIEKINLDLERLIPLGDVVFVSKEIARAHGARDMLQALEILGGKVKPGATLVCPWGECGAAGVDGSGQLARSPAFPPPEGLVDTVGAGDTFNAALIMELKRGKPLQEGLENACKVAGAKVGQKAFKGLGKRVNAML